MHWLRRSFEISHSNHPAIRSMEGLRGFAVFLVFLVHYVTLISPWMSQSSITHQISLHLRNIGNAGVDMFFVLSGYLIYGMLVKRHRPFGPYISRRIQRIYPTFIAVFSIYLALSFIFPAESKIPEPWFDASIYVIQNILLLPGLFDIDPVITVAWSLSYEVFYYLAIPLLISGFSMHAWPSKARMFFFLLLSLLGFGYCYLYGGHVQLVMFLAGVLLYEFLASSLLKKAPPFGLIALALSISSMLIIKELSINGWWRYVALYIFFFLLCWECFSIEGFTSRLFSFAPLRWYGNMSYSYYLIHGLTLKGAFLFLGLAYPPSGDGVWMFWAFLPPMFLITLVVSATLFLMVEKPYSLARRSPARKSVQA